MSSILDEDEAFVARVHDCLKEREVTDAVLAAELDVRPVRVRQALYALYDLRRATYRRDMDRETGYHIFHWTARA